MSWSAKAQRTYRQSLRTAVLARLGGRCIRCGFEDARALQIDHKYAGGRKEIGSYKGLYQYYLMLLRLSDQQFHANYQCLCANCNWIKRAEQNEHNKKVKSRGT